MKRILSVIFILLIAMTVSAYSESATSTLQEMYAQAELSMATGDYSGAAAQFEALGAYSDASQMAMYCKAIAAAETLGMYDIAVSAFNDLGDFKDSKQMAVYYTARSYQAVGDSYDLSTASYDALKDAKSYYDEGAEIYGGLALFKDCLTRLSECQAQSDAIEAQIASINEPVYQEALALEESGKYQDAINMFETIIDYRDSQEHIEACYEGLYQEALALEGSCEYQEAKKIFETIIDYRDSREHIEACLYQEALALEESGKYQDAINMFKEIEDYKDSKAHIDACYCKMAKLDSIVYTWYDGDKITTTVTELYSYDNQGFVSKVERIGNDGEIVWIKEYTVDDNGHIINSITTGDRSSSITTVTYESTTEYDEHGNPVDETTVYKASNNESYYKDGQIETEKWNYTYDKNGNIIVSEVYYNGASQPTVYKYEYTYDNNGVVLTTVRTTDRGTPKYYSYSYDSHGLLMEVKEETRLDNQYNIASYTYSDMDN